jgi:aerobic carbon-monoxide dehydrogenase medium subunit
VKPAPFEMHLPTSVSEVVALLDEHGDLAKPIAGGQSLVPMMSLRLASFEHLIDLNGVSELNQVSVNGDSLRIGAMVRQSTAEHDPQIVKSAPLVAKAIPHIGHFQIRNRGTVGGSIAHADPSSELPAVALALDATIEAVGPNGSREIAAKDFFVSTWETSLIDGEILTGVRFPIWSGKCGFVVEEVARRHGDFALVGVAAAVQVDGSKVTKAAIALFGVGGTPVRASEAEQALIAGGTSADLDAVGNLAAMNLAPSDDVHASGEYRKAVAATIVARAIAKALKEAQS